MSHKTFDKAQEITTSAGLGTLTFGGAVFQMQSFAAAGAVAADTFWCGVQHTDPTKNEWVIALATVVAGGTGITLGVPLSGSSGPGVAVNFSAGIKQIGNVAPSSKQIIADANGNFLFPGQLLTQGVRETAKAVAIAAGALPIDLTAASVFTATLNANVTALNITGMPAGLAGSFILELTADGTARTFTQPGSVVAMTGAYVPTSTVSKKDQLLYTNIGDGVWRMYIVFQNA